MEKLRPFGKENQHTLFDRFLIATSMDDINLELCRSISQWIDITNREELETGRPETMKPRSSDRVARLVSEELGVVIFDSSTREPAGFCALPYSFPHSSEGIIYELGSLIKSPTYKFNGVGVIATLATLILPKAIEAETIYAYANRRSLPLFTRKLMETIGIGARIIPKEELSTKFSYLHEYSGDTIVDLTTITNFLKSNSSSII